LQVKPVREAWDGRLKADVDAFDEIDDGLEAGREGELIEWEWVLWAQGGANLVTFQIESLPEMGYFGPYQGVGRLSVKGYRHEDI